LLTDPDHGGTLRAS